MLLLCKFTYGQITAKIYEDPEIAKIIHTHKKIAILPMQVSVKDAKSNKKNKLSDAEIVRMEEEYQQAFQNSMYSWFLKMKNKGRMTQEVQDVHKTNLILKRNSIEQADDL